MLGPPAVTTALEFFASGPHVSSGGICRRVSRRSSRASTQQDLAQQQAEHLHVKQGRRDVRVRALGMIARVSSGPSGKDPFRVTIG